MSKPTGIIPNAEAGKHHRPTDTVAPDVIKVQVFGSRTVVPIPEPTADDSDKGFCFEAGAARPTTAPTLDPKKPEA